MAELLDSGERREFGNGAVRDVAEGKGRCDLLPLKVMGEYLQDSVFIRVEDYIKLGEPKNLWYAIRIFCEGNNWDIITGLLEVAKQYEDGAKKYADRNWEKGIPVHVFIDSGVRHYLKYLRGDKDEPHDRAFIWNMLGAIWTHENKPELIDLPFATDINVATETPYDTYLEEMGEEDVSEPEYLSSGASLGKLAHAMNDEVERLREFEPTKGKYEGLSIDNFFDRLCAHSCDRCPIEDLSENDSCKGYALKNPFTFRKIAIDWLNKQDGLEGEV